MALVSKGTFLNVTMSDAAGDTSTMRYALDFADLAALNTGIATISDILVDINAVSDARIAAYSIGEAFVEDGSRYGDAGSEVEAVALITADIDSAVPGKVVTLKIPAPTSGIFRGTVGDDRNVVDIANADVQNYLANFSATGHILTSDGESIKDPTVAGNWKGKRIHRGSRNG